MPDGTYVYALWAEIPYNGCYYNKSSGVTNAPRFVPNAACTLNSINGQAFTGVKTLRYNVGQIAVERGLVDITIQPVSYSTVGSSPTAYGLDPFIFKYAISREATVEAKVTNTAGVTVKTLTPEGGITQVAQQLNTLSWDGQDDAGRMVTAGTYMFVVEAKDAMFPAVTNRASAVFPVDMYRVVDVSTTDVYGDSNAKATVSYSLSKAMNVQVNIYNKDVVIPNYQRTADNIIGTGSDSSVTSLAVGSVTITVNGVAYTNGVALLPNSSRDEYRAGNLVLRWVVTGTGAPYTVNLTVVRRPTWPPRVCDRQTDSAHFVSSTGPIDPSTHPECIYVNDTSFTSYPATPTTTSINVRLQPIKTFEQSSLQPGDGLTITEEWDALYFNNPHPAPGHGTCTSQTSITTCPYEMLPDGQYPLYISAVSNEGFDRYYDTDSTPFRNATDVVVSTSLYATDKVTDKINVTRGAVYFLDDSVKVYPNSPQLFNMSTGPVFVPPYEINFAVSRASTVDIEIVALAANMCTTGTGATLNTRAGQTCKRLTRMTVAGNGTFDADTIRKAYWDGTDDNGYYVKPGLYAVKLTAKNYPDAALYQETVKTVNVNADLYKVFDLLEADGYAISQRGTDMKIGYQVSVPMKVAIQILKPGTTIYNYATGSLRNPATGQEVQDIREVLVKAIVGIRPATTLIEELWDGTDYAGQEVPDGTYPFRFVTATDTSRIDTVTGEIIGTPAMNYVADKQEYQTLHRATVAVGDGKFVCEDWEKTVIFYPNPLTNASKGTLEITKMPVPGELSIKFYNLAGDLVRDSGYECIDANNYQVTMGRSLKFQPDNNPAGATQVTTVDAGQRNAALRCKWNRTNQHGKRVAHGVYFGLVDFKAQMGREHCQKVVKVLIP